MTCLTHLPKEPLPFAEWQSSFPHLTVSIYDEVKAPLDGGRVTSWGFAMFAICLSMNWGAIRLIAFNTLLRPLDEELLDEELGVVGVTELGVTAALSVDPPPPPPPHPAIASERAAVETYARIERIADLPPGRVSVFYEPFAVLIQRSPLSRQV